MLLLASASSNSSDDKPTPYAPPSVKELGQRITISGNIPVVEACFQELSITEKPMAEMKATDAQKIVDCTDEKTLSAFLKNPASNQSAMSNVVWIRASYLNTSVKIKEDANFARLVALKCSGNTPLNVDAFNECAGNHYRIENLKDKGLGLAFILALSAGVYGTYRLVKDRKSKLSNDNGGDAPGAQPS